jgi:quinol monooxygenase YgiN
MAEVQVIAWHTMAPGAEPEVLAVLPRLLAATRAEPGCVSFDAYRRIDDDSSYVLLERFVSAEAFAEHRGSAHFQDIVEGQIAPRLTSRVYQTFDVDPDRRSERRAPG